MNILGTLIAIVIVLFALVWGYDAEFRCTYATRQVVAFSICEENLKCELTKKDIYSTLYFTEVANEACKD